MNAKIAKEVLIISPEPWTHIFVSKHHYACEFARRGYIVYFLNPPNKSLGCKIRITPTDILNIYTIDYFGQFRGLRFLPKYLRAYLNCKFFKKLSRLANINIDVILLFENSRFYDLELIKKNITKIYFQVDENQRFNQVNAVRSSDLVFAINNVITLQLKKIREDVTTLSHAFSGIFTDQAMKLYRGDIVYNKNIDRVQAFYVGNLDHGYSDIDLIVELVSKCADVDFHFIGPYSIDGEFFNGVKNLKNVILYGRINASDIPSKLDRADLLFYAYRDNFRSASHKVMEYLASGKAIVARNIEGYSHINHLIYSVDNRSDFIPLFKHLCFNLNEANSTSNMRDRIDYAMKNTYASRLNEIEMLVNDLSNR